MNTVLVSVVILLGTTGALASTGAFAQEEDDEAADLKSYSVGERRPSIEQQKVTIERPKFENTFKLTPSKPAISGIQLARPKLEVLTGPETGTADSAPTRTAEASGATASVGRGETRPVQPLSMDPPEYPRDAYRRRQEGFVIVEFTINAQGNTENVTIIDAEPRGAFDTEARRAVSRWTFQPALRDGRPVPQRIRHTLEFSLNSR